MTQQCAPWYLPIEVGILNPLIDLNTDANTSFIHSCQTWKQPKCPSVSEQINQLNGFIHPNTGMLLSTIKK